MLLLFKIASFPVLGQGKINDKLFEGDSSKYVSVFGDSNIIQSYIKNFSIPKIQLPFDLKGKRPSELLTNEDSTLNWKRFVPEISGQIAIGYDAGQLANYLMPDNLRPMHVFHTEGSLKTDLAKVPVQIAYRYATVKNPIGINNYFRVSFDTERFKQQPKLNEAKVQEVMGEQFKAIAAQKGELNGKLGYTELLKEQLKLKIERELDAQQERLKAIALSKVDAELAQTDSIATDSLMNLSTAKRDSIQQVIDSEKAFYASSKQQADSLQLVFETKKSQIEQLKQQVDTVQFYIDKLVDFRNQLDSLEGNLLSQKETWMTLSKGVTAKNLQSLGLFKKLDIGLTYPKTSALSKNSIPVKGIDLEIQKGKLYAALTAGVTMNNLMVTNNALQNSLQNTSNLFNQFDFQQISQQRLLIFAKTGYGEKEKTHAFIGVRFMNKGVETGFSADTTENTDPAAGIELDIRWVPSFSKGTAFDLVYGKTSKTLQAQDSLRNSPFVSLFSSERTHTGLFRMTQQLTKIHSSIIASIRFLDSDADMASMGVLQPNNLRYEIQTRHKLSGSTQLGFIYRSDQDNVNQISDTTRKVAMYGMNINSVLFENINASGTFNYLNQQFRVPSSIPQALNYMASLSVSGNYEILKVKQVSSLQTDFYKITTSQGETQLKHIGFDQSTRFEDGKNTFTLAYFNASLPDTSEQNTTWLVQEAFAFKRKKLDYSIGVKLANSSKYGVQFGGHLGLQYAWTSQLNLKMRIEKLILGDFYNTYDPTRFERFPFYIQTSLTYQLK
jgi:hypothetical protein